MKVFWKVKKMVYARAASMVVQKDVDRVDASVALMAFRWDCKLVASTGS